MKHRELYTYIVLLIVVFFSFSIPKIVTVIEEEKIFSKTYVVDRTPPALAKNGGKTDFIDTIYSRYNHNQKYDVVVSDNNRSIKEILKVKDNAITSSDDTGILNKIEELTKKNILEDSFLKNLMKEETIIYRIWDYDNGEITYSNIKFFTDGDSFKTAIASIEVENTTNKIIAFTFRKEYMDMNKSKLENYVTYLGLDTFSDWEYNNNELLSKEAQIKITSINENEYGYVKVVPLQV